MISIVIGMMFMEKVKEFVIYKIKINYVKLTKAILKLYCQVKKKVLS